MSNENAANAARRQALGTMGIAVAGLAAGLAGGVAVGQSTNPTAPLAHTGRRRFEDKVIAITGATSGIGRAAAIAFAAEGGKVAFCGRREQLGHEVEQEIRAAGGEATYIKADVLVEEQVRAFIDRTLDIYGRLDVAFNNAGITIEKPLHEFSTEEWDRVAHTNLRGVFFAMKYEIPQLIASGGGTIVVTSSSVAVATGPKRSVYTATKRGLVGLVQAAALDYASKGIRVNALLPGTTDTELVRRVAGMEKFPDLVWAVGSQQWAKSHVPGLQRMARPEEIAAFALGLASDEYSYLTGAALVIDGGQTAHAG